MLSQSPDEYYDPGHSEDPGSQMLSSNEIPLMMNENAATDDTTCHGIRETGPTLSNSYSTNPFTDAAALSSKQIKEDKDQCRSIITKYGVNPHELLHLLERWTQLLIEEYKKLREHFKLKLKEEWDRGRLHGVKWNEDTKLFDILQHLNKLTDWKKSGEQLSARQYQDESQLDNNNLKEIINQQIDKLSDLLESISFINESSVADSNSELAQIKTSSSHLKETSEQLRHLRELNEKEFNIVCIIGLEKAGKSSFINALLGFELLPHK